MMNEVGSNAAGGSSAGSMPEDTDLLRRYADEGSEAAFAELVRRRIGLVYAVALRQTHGDRHRAEDVTQAVFTDLARKAGSLSRRPVLAGWLYRSAQYAAAGIMRAESRRLRREQDAETMKQLHDDTEPEADWNKVRPVLDGVLSEVPEADRDVVLLRYFDGRRFADIGQRLGLTENSARMRVDRALQKLNAALAKKGITSTTAALATALAPHAPAAVPAGLAASVAGAALAKSAAVGGGFLAATLGLGKIQATVAAALVVTGGALFYVQQQSQSALREEIARGQHDPRAVAALRAENRRLAQLAVEVESMRGDDAELKRLAEEVASVQTAAKERARVAGATRTASANARAIQAEIDRMNLEGNALVEQYKALVSRSKDASLTAAERSAAETQGKAKLGEIQAKQREVRAYIDSMRALHPGLQLPGWQARRSADLELRKGSAPSPMDDGDRISMRLPRVDTNTALMAAEQFFGKKIVRDASLAGVVGRLNLETEALPKQEALGVLETALRDQLNITLEPMADGTLVAKVRESRR